MESRLHTVERKLGINIIREQLGEYCVSTMGKTLVGEMKFTSDPAAVSAMLDLTAQMKSVHEGDSVLSLQGLTDVTPWLATLRLQGSWIDVADLWALHGALGAARGVSRFFAATVYDGVSPYPALASLAAEIAGVDEALAIINRLLGPDGQVRDNASPALADIRSRQATINARIQRAMRQVMSAALADGIIDQDARPALRDGRLVLPVAAMNKRRLQGIVHDESATGKTYFIEPGPVVELNNEQRELGHEERREIVRLLTAAAADLNPLVPVLSHTFAVMAQLDFVSAKARFAMANGGNPVTVSPGPAMRLFRAVHPLLRQNLAARGRQVVPLDLDLDAHRARILVVSGPNAGGKSVVLKTIGVMQYMLQCGMLPCCDAHSHMGIFDHIFLDIGDDQSIEDDLSTYSSHLRNMRNVLEHGTDRSLILIDEFGSGTEPIIGGAIAQAMLTDFNSRGMWGVVTTHYQNLKQLASETPGIVNGSMVYDRQKMTPAYQLAVGQPGSSFAIEIARKSGLPAHIIEAAGTIAGSDYVNMDKYLLDIARDRRYWERKRADIRQREKKIEEVLARYSENAESLRTRRREIIDEAKAQADMIISQSNAAVERTIRDIRQAAADKERTRAARQQLDQERRRLAQTTPGENKQLSRAPKAHKPSKPKVTEPQKPLQPGDRVILEGQSQPGQIIAVEGRKATVAFGAMKVTVATDRLKPTMRAVASGADRAASFVTVATRNAMRDKQLNFKSEIDVRGMRADEAIQAVTYFIDDALQLAVGRVRILHGTGTGALRLAIRAYLDTVAGVSAYRDEDVRFGGAGITVVEL